MAMIVEAELTAVGTHKTSLETRAFSLITANLAIATLYFALRTQLGFTADTADGPVRTVLVIALIAVAVSVVAAVLAAVPLRYATFERSYPRQKSGQPEPEHQGLAALLDDAESGASPDLDTELLQARIYQLDRGNSSNSFKAGTILLAFVATSIAVGLFVAAIVIAAPH
ncbi:hypothetical protein ASE16_02030 [Leifsonia sp. Root227]|nr:hypothetical protein ASE16_02030 [Leifsonia sp. Root227]